MKKRITWFVLVFCLMAVEIPLTGWAKEEDFKRVDITPKENGEVFDGKGPFGLGIILGEPSGITGKLWLTEGNALQMTASWSLNHDSFIVIGDYTYSFWYIIRSADAVAFPLYVGFGGALGIGGKEHPWDKSDPKLALRIPLGLAVAFRRAPVEIFLEVAPAILVIPEVEGDVMGGIGARFYF
ncbi:MAG: hypothetical protein Kow0090_19260 [Myxococcota bacterium]